MDIEMHPQGMLGASFNYLHNRCPTDWTLLLSHFSFRLYSFGTISLNSNESHLSIYCKQCFNPWVAAALCLLRCLLGCWGEYLLCVKGVELEGKLSWWTSARSKCQQGNLGVSARLWDLMYATRSFATVFSVFLTKVVLWTGISQISCAVLKQRK